MAVVAFDLTPWSTGSRMRGIGTYTLDLGRALAAAPPSDLELRFLVGSTSDYRLVTADGGLNPERVTALCGGDRLTGYQRYYLHKRLHMWRFLDGAGVDLLHAPDPKGTRPGRRCRTVITAHDLIPTVLGRPYRWYPEAVSTAIDRQRYLRHDHVIAISDWTAHDLERIAGLPRSRATVVHHGVDHARFRPDGPSADLGAPYFLYAGGFDARKQVPGLIRAFAEVAHDQPALLLAIAGKPDPGQREDLERVARRAGVADRVRILGFVPLDELPGLYRGAVAHVLPTLYEGFGFTAVEAMACGCPVITLRATCVPEICGGAAAYAEPGDWPAFSAAMRRVARDPEHRAALRAKGLARAAGFTWERAAAQTLDVYREVLRL